MRICIVGCGAVSQNCHLPAVFNCEGAQLTALVDMDETNLAQLKERYNINTVSTDPFSILDEFDAAIVATPNAFHASLSVRLLRAGKHVMVDKPMALGVTEAQVMINAALTANKVLFVGQIRRQLFSLNLVKDFLRMSVIGRPLNFYFSEGNIFSWPVKTRSVISKEVSGGGVLIDGGAHTVDMVTHLLGPIKNIEYFDDRVHENGVESYCISRVELEGGVSGVIELSRISNLSNLGIIECESGYFVLDLRSNKFSLIRKETPQVITENISDYSVLQGLEGFVPHNAGSRIDEASDDEAGVCVKCEAFDGRNAGFAFGKDDASLLEVQPNTLYTANLRMKALDPLTADTPLLMRVGNQDFDFVEKEIINLSTDWDSYPISFTTGKNDQSCNISVWKLDNDNKASWLCSSIQLRKGFVTDYKGDDEGAIIFDSMGPPGVQSFQSVFHSQMQEFLEATTNENIEHVYPENIIPSIDFIQRSYAERLNIPTDLKRLLEEI